MCYRRRAAAAWLCALLAGGGCGRAPRPTVERLGVLPLENLTADASLDWLSLFVPFALEAGLAGSPGLLTFPVATGADAQLGRPSMLLRGYFAREGERLVVTAFLADASSGQNLRMLKAARPAGASASLAADLARQLSENTFRAAAPSPEGARALGEALLASDPGKSLSLLGRVVELEPRFAEARLLLAQRLVAAGDRAGAMNVLRAAFEGGPLTPIAGARLQAALASLGGDAGGRVAALEKLAALLPADPEPAVQLADYLVLRRQYGKALDYYRKALDADPQFGALWNQAAYAQAHAGQVETAIGSLREYARLAPASANPLDSLGEIYFLAGRFTEAERAFLDSYRKDPAFLASITLRKAAEARLMTGDLEGADALFAKYADAASQHPLLEIQRARWEYLTGRRDRALGRIRAFAAKDGLPADLASMAEAQLAVWLLHSGDRAAARQAAEQAGAIAATLSARRMAAICLFVTSPEAHGAEAAIHAERRVEDPVLRRHALAYALLFSGRFNQAAPILKALYEETHPNNTAHLKELLAWAYVELGRFNDARPLAAAYPIPQSFGEPAFECLVFPRLFQVRARLAERSGETQKAAEFERLFRKLSGAG